VHQHEVFTRVLEVSLRKRGLRAEVMNTGVSGFGTAEQLVYLENEGIHYKPDAVVLALFGNDYLDSARSGLFALQGGELVEQSRRYAPAVEIIKLTGKIPGLKWLGENSYAYSYLFNAVWDIVKVWSMERARSGEGGTEKSLAQPEYAVPRTEVGQAEEALVIALLKRFGEFGRRNGMTTLLADVPRLDGPGRIRTSFTPAVRSAGMKSFSHVLESDAYLGDRPPNQHVHVPHGHHHINAYAHRRLGEAIAEVLAKM
jgi:hypothetical protein